MFVSASGKSQKDCYNADFPAKARRLGTVRLDLLAMASPAI
jgi:hypothetical protein